MRTFEQLEAQWHATEASPRSRGTVALIVARLGGGKHRVLDRGELTLEEGLVGDRWSRGPHPSRARQVTLMNVRVAKLVADGQPLHLPGDNLLVDLDLSTEVAPPGTRISLGTALLEVTAKPHTGCAKFEARFGADALRWVNEAHPAQRLRGINCCVLRPGVVAVGDPVTIEDPQS